MNDKLNKTDLFISLELKKISKDNVGEYYQRLYYDWCYYNSVDVEVDGESVNLREDENPTFVNIVNRYLKRQIKRQHDENGFLIGKEFVVKKFENDEGTPLCEELYIELRKKEFQEYLFEVKGVAKYINNAYRLKILLEYMEQREKELSKPTQTAEKRGFDSKLNAEQIKELVPWLNLAELFENSIDEPILMNLFNGSLESPLKLNNNRLLAYFLNKLSKKKLITKYWQAAAERTKSFISFDDKEIICNDLSKALSALEKNGNPKNSEFIDEAISQL